LHTCIVDSSFLLVREKKLRNKKITDNSALRSEAEQGRREKALQGDEAETGSGSRLRRRWWEGGCMIYDEPDFVRVVLRQPAKLPCVRQFSQLCLLLRRSGAAGPMTAKTIKKTRAAVSTE
jgi:hypothetical protein